MKHYYFEYNYIKENDGIKYLPYIFLFLGVIVLIFILILITNDAFSIDLLIAELLMLAGFLFTKIRLKQVKKKNSLPTFIEINNSIIKYQRIYLDGWGMYSMKVKKEAYEISIKNVTKIEVKLDEISIQTSDKTIPFYIGFYNIKDIRNIKKAFSELKDNI